MVRPRVIGGRCRGNEALARELKTDADGRFAWNDAPDRGISASVWAEGFAAKDSLTLAPDVDHRIVLIAPTADQGAPWSTAVPVSPYPDSR